MSRRRSLPRSIERSDRDRAPAGDRLSSLRRGLALAWVTLAWNVIECTIAIVSGIASRSVVLIGYGFDSFIEAGSSAIIVVRIGKELAAAPSFERERIEGRAARAAGALLVVLAATIGFESVRRLTGAGVHPADSPAGIVLTAIAVVAMPVLGAGKLRVARRVGSEALRIEAEQTIACAWFSLTALLGLVLNATLGWWWADPVSALTLVPWMVREGSGPWRRPAAFRTPARGDARSTRQVAPPTA